MSDYLVSARRYRPVNFDEVIGQDSIVDVLRNEILNNKIGHAYLFYGPRGTGKTSTARIFAKSINCINAINNNGNACEKCDFCKNSANNNIAFFELDAASNNSVEDIRRITEEARMISVFYKYKVFIIDEIHMLTQSAFNAFLKTLEEPQKNVVFILATTDFHKVPATIISRCQVLNFKLIDENIIVQQLQKILQNEDTKYETEALNIIAKQAYGSMRDALSILDALIANNSEILSVEKVQKTLNILDNDNFFEICNCIFQGDKKNTILTFEKIIENGIDILYFLNEFLEYFMQLYYVKNGIRQNLNNDEGFYEQSQKIDNEILKKCINEINETIMSHRNTINKKLHTELLLINLIDISTKKNI